MEKEYKLNRNRKQRRKLREEIKQHEESITPTHLRVSRGGLTHSCMDAWTGDNKMWLSLIGLALKPALALTGYDFRQHIHAP